LFAYRAAIEDQLVSAPRQANRTRERGSEQEMVHTFPLLPRRSKDHRRAEGARGMVTGKERGG
jgi:hypothetical protein